MFHKAFWNKSTAKTSSWDRAANSFEYAWEKHRQWREEYFGDPGVVVGRRQGPTPSPAHPFDGGERFHADLATQTTQNKPLRRRRVSGFTAVEIAVDVPIRR